MKTKFELWWHRLMDLCQVYSIDTSNLAVPSYFERNNYHDHTTPEQYIIDIFKSQIENAEDIIKSLDPDYITDTDRLEFLFDREGDIAFFKPSGYDGRDDGRWDIYFEFLALVESDANFRDDIDAIMSVEKHRKIKEDAKKVAAESEEKGTPGGKCNLTACQRPQSAIFFNKSTKKHYCYDCAKEINWPGGRKDTMQLYGTQYLCELDYAALATLPNDSPIKELITGKTSEELF